MKILNQGLFLDDFKKYVDGLIFTTWKPVGITIHHTAAPSLAQRPQGLKGEHIKNIQSFYEKKGWSAGPHLFTDEDQCWLFSPLTSKGVHAKSFNNTHIGIEMLGDYDKEDPTTGRGLKVLTITAKTTAILLNKLKLPLTAINFHRDDPKTDKSCPGTKIKKDKFIELVKLFI